MMNMQRYLKFCEQFPPRLLTTFDDYLGAKRTLVELEAIPNSQWDDAVDMFCNLLRKLTSDFVSQQYAMVRRESEDWRRDRTVFSLALKLNPLSEDELFRRTAFTPMRVAEILNGDLLCRREIVILCDALSVPPDLFTFNNIKATVKTDKVVVIRMSSNQYDLMECGTCRRRSLPESWKQIPVVDCDDSEQFLTPNDPAFRYLIDDWVRANQSEIHEEVFGAKQAKQ